MEDACICPSFNSYSSDKLAEIAVRVAGERSVESVDDFEFALVRGGTAEEFFYDGQVRPVFPLFKSDLLQTGGDEKAPESETTQTSVVIPLSKLFTEEDNERNHPPSCSSSEAEELEAIPAGTYCVWRPKMEDPPLPGQCKKSRSTGSGSKRWKIRELLRRSKSNGNENIVFLTPKLREAVNPNRLIQAPKAAATATAAAPRSAHEAFYVRNRAMKEGEKKKSYLPYRQDLVGFFANVSGVRRSFSNF